jgi:CHAD domain-containing protein
MSQHAFKLRRDESFDDGIKRIVVAQIDKAIHKLEDKLDDPDEAVHDARVCTKKIRAVLRLIKHSLGREVFNDEDKSFRDTARLLASVRDSAAMLELDILDQDLKEERLHPIIQTVREFLSQTKSAKDTERATVTAEAIELLRESRERVSSWPEASHHIAITRGLKRTFKQGRIRLEEAYELGSVEAFHEWRKSVKHLLYQVRVLGPVWPSLLKALAKDLKRLSDFLSEDHDLAILKQKITTEMDLADDELAALVDLIDESRKHSQQRARSLGARIYADKPRAFVKRIETSWREWQKQ